MSYEDPKNQNLEDYCFPMIPNEELKMPIIALLMPKVQTNSEKATKNHSPSVPISPKLSISPRNSTYQVDGHIHIRRYANKIVSK